MDVSAKTGTRAWLMGAATAGLFAPGLLMGQENRPAADRENTGGSGALVAESEVEQQLRLLYERDGREMPKMRLTQSPTPQAQPSPTAAMQPRYSSAPVAAPPKSSNRFTSFFKKLIPGSNKPVPTRNASTPPRQLPPVPPQPGLQQPQRISGPATTASPAIPGGNSGFPRPFPPTPQPSIGSPSNAAIAPAADGRPSAITTTLPADDVGTDEEFVAPPVPTNADADAEEDNWPDSEADQADQSGEMFDEPLQGESSPVESMPPQLDDDFPDPFGEAVETQPEQPEIEEPYTGKSLNEEAPAALPVPADVKPVTESAPETAVEDAEESISAEESTAAKMRRILQRVDAKGLKGFCPVTLRDQRELADSRPEFVSSYRGQKFYFATKAAQTKFDEDPARYAPVAYGADVVVLVKQEDVVEGSLDFAAWYKGRLYLFGSQETHDLFVASPQMFAKPPGIE